MRPRAARGRGARAPGDNQATPLPLAIRAPTPAHERRTHLHLGNEKRFYSVLYMKVLIRKLNKNKYSIVMYIYIYIYIKSYRNLFKMKICLFK